MLKYIMLKDIYVLSYDIIYIHKLGTQALKYIMLNDIYVLSYDLIFFTWNRAWGNPLGISPHFKDGTWDKPNFVESRGFFDSLLNEELNMSLTGIEPRWGENTLQHKTLGLNPIDMFGPTISFIYIKYVFLIVSSSPKPP
jgi:hypothetical protein